GANTPPPAAAVETEPRRGHRRRERRQDRAPNGRKSRAERPVPVRQREEIQEVPRGLSARRRYADTPAVQQQTNSPAQVAFRRAGPDLHVGARAAPPDRNDPRHSLRP